MCGVVHGFHEVHVAGRTTHIFRRASIFASQAHRPIVTALLRWQALLDGDDVFLAIAEVVVIGEGLDLFAQDGANGELSFIEHVVAADPFLVKDAVAPLLYVPVM